MAFEDGILVGTRGLNDDLLGVDPIGVRAALACRRRNSTPFAKLPDIRGPDRRPRTELRQSPASDQKSIQIIGGTRTARSLKKTAKGLR